MTSFVYFCKRLLSKVIIYLHAHLKSKHGHCFKQIQGQICQSLLHQALCEVGPYLVNRLLCLWDVYLTQFE